MYRFIVLDILFIPSLKRFLELIHCSLTLAITPDSTSVLDEVARSCCSSLFHSCKCVCAESSDRVLGRQSFDNWDPCFLFNNSSLYFGSLHIITRSHAREISTSALCLHAKILRDGRYHSIAHGVRAAVSWCPFAMC